MAKSSILPAGRACDHIINKLSYFLASSALSPRPPCIALSTLKSKLVVQHDRTATPGNRYEFDVSLCATLPFHFCVECTLKYGLEEEEKIVQVCTSGSKARAP